MKKKILNIVSGTKSGALNIALVVGQYLKEQGHDIELIFRKYNKTDEENVTVVKDRFTLDYIKCLAELIKKERPDIILVHGYSTHLWTKMAVAAAKTPLRLIHVEHNAERYTLLRSWLMKKLDVYTAQYICVSKGVANHLIQHGADPDKVAVIYNGIDLEKFNIEKQPHEIFTIGMVARFSKQKDQMTLIKAVELLVKEKKLQVNLILMGEGKKKKECIAYVESHGLGNYIRFEVGSMLDLLPRIDLFVLSTHYEGLPLVLCEAMAARVPVIATNVPGVDEIITEDKIGDLVPENDIIALANILGFYKLSNCELNVKVEYAFRKLEKIFTINEMCKDYEKKINLI